MSRAKQLQTAGDSDSTMTTTEAVSPMELKYCVDAQHFTSCIALGLMKDVTSFAALTNKQLRAYLDDKAKESKEAVTMEGLDAIVSKELVMDMANSNAKSRMEGLFIRYHSILNEQGLTWIVQDNQKLAVSHVLSAIRPVTLKERLESDLGFSQHALKKDFHGFLKHAVKLSEAFQLVDSGPRRRPRKEDKQRRSGNPDKPPRTDPPVGSERELPLCLYEPCRRKGIRHLLRNCPDCPHDEKNRLRRELAEKKAATGPAHSTRSKTARNQDQQTNATQTKTPVTGKISHAHSQPGCEIVLKDDTASHNCHGRCDDGSDESLVSPRVAEAATIKGIGKMRKIEPVIVQVALRKGENAETFTFSRQWTVPRLVLQLSAGPLALLNVTMLVADAELADEDILIGRPVLAHLGIDSRTMLEAKRSTLHETDCKKVRRNATTDSRIGRILIARIKGVNNPELSLPDTGVKQTSAWDNKQPNLEGTEQTPTQCTPLDRPRSNYFGNRADVDPFPNPNLIDLPDADQKPAIKHAVEQMLTDALAQGFPRARFDDLRKLVLVRINVFRTTFSKGEPAKIPPLELHLKANAKPVQVKLRKYNNSQRRFLTKLVSKLLEANLIYANPSSRWACAPHLVPKPGPAEWRFTVDLRPVNCQTHPQAFPLPLVEVELEKASGAKHFSEFDMIHSYWQLALHHASQECQSFITPDGIYTPKRVLHGNLCANSHLHSSFVSHMNEDLKSRLMIWVDDLVLPAKTIDDVLSNIRKLLDLCVQINFKLHPEKCRLYKRSVTWCGRELSADGIRFSPRNISGLEEMHAPTTAAQLLQFTSALQWLRTSIPNFSVLIQPLLAALERAYEKIGKRTKRALQRVELCQIGWSEIELEAFEKCKAALHNRVRLSHRDHKQKLCFYTDASDTHWAGICTQVPIEDIHKPHADKRHEPLSFLSGRFDDTQLRWSTLEKEAYAIMASIDRMHWLASGSEGFDLFTDHNNLIFIFDPTSLVPDLTVAAIRKVIRWAVRLSMYAFECIHISGVDNTWADMMTRWSPPPTIRRVITIPPLPSANDDEFVWPTANSIAETQQHHNPPPSAIRKDGLYRTTDHKIWIPEQADDLQLRLCVIAHTSAGGHRGKLATKTAISEKFSWSTLSEDVDLFVASCIHCLSTTGGEKIPRPFGPAVFGTSPNELLQFDFLELGKSTTGDKYVLMLRDDHSGYTWIYPSITTDAEHAATAVIDWCAAFGPPSTLMSDGPTHFRNETMRQVAKGLKCKHHFTTAYCPWSNGGIERLGKEILRTARSLLSELKMRLDSWPDILPVIQNAINQAPSAQRDNICPITAFTGMASKSPVTTFIRSDTAKPVTVTQAVMERNKNLTNLLNAVANLRPVVQSSLSDNRRRLRAHMSKGRMPNFMEGDYVLVAKNTFHRGEKLCLRWCGPRRVVKALNNHIFQIEDLRNGEIESIHATRLKYYSDSALDTKAIMSHVVNSEMGMPVARLMRFVESEDGIKIQVRWKGLSPQEDTLEPLQNVFEDVPQMFHKLLQRSATPKRIAEKVRQSLNL